MITNFKIFENDSDKKYWKIKISRVENDSEFIDLQLYKIGMPDKNIKEYEFLHYHNEDAFIGYAANNPKYKYSYTAANDDFFDRNGFEYMGNVEITEEDVAEYEMRKNAKKYNI